LVAVEAHRIDMPTHEIEGVLAGIQGRPRLGGHVAVAASHPSHRFVGAHVTRAAVGKLGIELPFDVAIQADVHGTDDVATDRIEPVGDCPMAIATVHLDFCAVRERVVRRPQPVFWELAR
jgi:hypothetical protein